MNQTQLFCPHCGSTLTFGPQIATGATVDCLICMPAFPAVTPAAVAAAAPSPAMVKTKPAAAAARPKQKTEKAEPDVAKPTAPSIRKPQGGGTQSNSGLVFLTIAFLL